MESCHCVGHLDFANAYSGVVEYYFILFWYVIDILLSVLSLVNGLLGILVYFLDHIFLPCNYRYLVTLSSRTGENDDI